MRADITTIVAANFLRPCLIEGVRRRSSHGLYSVFFNQTAVAGQALCRFEWNLTAGAIAFNPLITRGSGTQRVLRQMF